MEIKYIPFKMTIEGQEVEALLTENDWTLILEAINKNKTGYERVTKENGIYYFDNGGGYVGDSYDPYPETEGNNAYKAANYYTSKIVAENNVRADKLMRQLRRFAVEHRTNDKIVERYYIYYLRDSNLLQLRRDTVNCFVGPWFDNQHAGAQAIETFHDELIWYFTEYKDSL